jgi:hypothetical protein
MRGEDCGAWLNAVEVNAVGLAKELSEFTHVPRQTLHRQRLRGMGARDLETIDGHHTHHLDHLYRSSPSVDDGYLSAKGGSFEVPISRSAE